MDVVEADLFQQFHFVADVRHGFKKVGGFLHGHVQHIGNGLALEMDFQGFAVITLALAHIAGDVDVGQEVHLDFNQAVAGASFATPALDVE